MKENVYSAVRSRRLVSALLALLLLFCFVCPVRAQAASPEDIIIQTVNEIRAEKGLPALIGSEAINEATRQSGQSLLSGKGYDWSFYYNQAVPSYDYGLANGTGNVTVSGMQEDLREWSGWDFLYTNQPSGRPDLVNRYIGVGYVPTEKEGLYTFFVAILAVADAAPIEGMFDATYYATAYPDVAAAVGSNSTALLNHYLNYGMQEGRVPYAGAAPGAAVFQPVPLANLANLKSLRKKANDDEMAQAYDIALRIVAPYANKSRTEQLQGIYKYLRGMVDDGLMSYSMSSEHYNDPYGYLVQHTASCAGSVRATGLCLSILGIPYEHVNENQYSHQWARVQMEDGSYWICDPYGCYCGPEKEPYKHPTIS